jgi:hypothetical protein
MNLEGALDAAFLSLAKTKLSHSYAALPFLLELHLNKGAATFGIRRDID